MRFPVIGDISTKDGDGNQNARLTNMLAEQKKNGTTLATVRPGLNGLATGSGTGNSLVCFGGELVNVYGDTVYQAVPVGGVGAEYSINYLPMADYWTHVIWNGNKFCAIGYNYSATSTDGLTWEYGSMPFTAWWGSVAWNGTIFCAIMRGLSGYSPYVHACATSEDGLTWTARELPTTDEEDDNGNSDIASNGTLFVTAAYDAGSYFFTSTDGITWTPRACPAEFAGYGGLFAYGGGKFVAMTRPISTTYVTTSADGITWAASTTTSVAPASSLNYARLVYENNNFVTVANGNFQYSADGVSWSSFAYGTAIASAGAIWDGGKYIIYGNQYLVSGVDAGDYPWEASSPYTEWWFSAASDGTRIVIVGTGDAYAYTDSHLVNISDPTYTLEEIGTVTDNFFDFALIP